PHSFELFTTTANQEMFARFRDSSRFTISVLPAAAHRLRDAAARASSLAGDQLFRHASNALHAGLRRRMDACCDLLYTPTVTLAFFNSRRATLLSPHDLQHLHYPEFFSRWRLRARSSSYAVSIRRAVWLQASSEFI